MSVQRIIKLEPITYRDYYEIKELTSDIEVMKYIGNGKVWTPQKVSKFIQYCVEEEKMDESERTQYYYKIMEYKTVSTSKRMSSSGRKTGRITRERYKSKRNRGNTRNSKFNKKMKKYFIGIIGFHKFIKGDEPYLTREQKNRKDEYYLTVFKSRKFHGGLQLPAVMKLLIEKMKKHIPEKDSLYLWVKETNERMNLYSRKHYKFIGKVRMNPKLVLNEYQYQYK